MLIKKIIASAGAMLVAFFAVFQLAAAQSQQGSGGNGLQMSPTRTELNLSPGEHKTFDITLKNITAGDLTAEVSVNDFESDGVSGNPQIIVDDSQRTPSTIYNFISNLRSVELKPDESKKVTLNVDVPKDASPGAYYGVVRYAAIPKGGILSDRERQLALNASVAHLVLIEVTGEINEQIQIDDLAVGKSGENGEIKSGSIFFTAPNKSLLTLNNLGNGFSRPFGTVTINRMFAGEVYTSEINNIQPKGIVLPHSTRVFTDDIQGIKIPGRYTATAAVAYGNGGEVITYKISFWYLPIWFLVILAVILAAIIIWIYRRYKGRYVSGAKKKKRS